MRLVNLPQQLILYACATTSLRPRPPRQNRGTVIFRRPRPTAKTPVRLFSADEERMVDRLNPPFISNDRRKAICCVSLR
eukprot:6178529-Pleurochrysis_carterae.AAC.1